MSEFHAKLREAMLRALCCPGGCRRPPDRNCVRGGDGSRSMGHLSTDQVIAAISNAIAAAGYQIVPEELPRAIAKEAMSDAIANGDLDNMEHFRPDANIFWSTALDRLAEADAKEDAK